MGLLNMMNGNPNQSAQPFKPVDFTKSGHMQGTQNPYGFGAQRTLGAIAPQQNVAGMATNTLPGQGFGQQNVQQRMRALLQGNPQLQAMLRSRMAPQQPEVTVNAHPEYPDMRQAMLGY